MNSDNRVGAIEREFLLPPLMAADPTGAAMLEAVFKGNRP